MINKIVFVSCFVLFISTFQSTNSSDGKLKIIYTKPCVLQCVVIFTNSKLEYISIFKTDLNDNQNDIPMIQIGTKQYHIPKRTVRK